MGFLDSLFNMADRKELKNFAKIAEKIDAMEPRFESMRDKELKHMTVEFKERLAKVKL
jgi:Preprotein translocase subunit SecA (ATPase, RNA helicase)